MLRSSATVQFVNDNDNDNVNDNVNVVSTIEVCVWLRLWVICISSVWVSEQQQVRGWNNRVVLRSGRVSDNMAVFLSYTTEDRYDTVLHQGTPRGKFCPCSGNGQTLALPRHAASGVAGAQGLHGL